MGTSEIPSLFGWQRTAPDWAQPQSVEPAIRYNERYRIVVRQAYPNCEMQPDRS
jgi:hypothetical protein